MHDYIDLFGMPNGEFVIHHVEVRKTAAPDSKPPKKRHVFGGGTTTIFQKTLLGLRGRGGSKSAP